MSRRTIPLDEETPEERRERIRANEAFEAFFNERLAERQDRRERHGFTLTGRPRSY